MRSLRVYSTLALLTGGAAGSCTIDRSPDSDPLISIEDGVEVATPPAIPAPFDPRYEWEFRALREIPAGGPGPGHDPLVFNPARALPLRNGTLLVHDPQADAPLVILDPTQRSALYRFGRNGQGPGELSPLVDLSENPDGSLRVLARANRQVLTYGPDGTYLGSERLEFEEYPFKSLPAPDTEGHFVEVGTRGPGAWVRRVARVELDPPRLLPGVELAEPAPGARGTGIQYGRALWSVVGEHLVTMRSENPTVTVHDLSGNLVREIRLPLSRRTLSESDIQEQISLHGPIARSLEPGPAALTNELYAASDSVFGMLMSALWRAAEDPRSFPDELWWRLFSLHGRYIGMVRVPEDVNWLWQGSDRFWAFSVTADGEPVIQELMLRRKMVE